MSKITKANKVVIIGDSNVGKTCIIQRFISNSFNTSKPTIGACHYNKKVQDVEIDIWDTAGQERFKSMIPMYYKGAKAIIVVYDITDANSFDGAKKWISEIETNTKNSIIVICGNKSDLNENRTVPIETVNSFLLGKNYINIETSAKENTNIDQMFDKIAEEIKKSKEIEDNNKIDIHSASTKSGNSSCNYCS